MSTTEYRIERDSMGELKVPATALWGAQTQRAVQNFPISGRPMPRTFISALGLIKAGAARANAALDLLDAEVDEGVRLETLIERFFADPRTAFLHVHNARRGCYACRIDRA